MAEWISVKDKLPEDDEDVILLLREVERYGLHKEKAKTYYFVYHGSYDGERWYTNWCHGCKYIEDANAKYPDETYTVTHWMPEPELPRMDGEDE
jgi:hypothetical protein